MLHYKCFGHFLPPSTAKMQSLPPSLAHIYCRPHAHHLHTTPSLVTTFTKVTRPSYSSVSQIYKCLHTEAHSSQHHSRGTTTLTILTAYHLSLTTWSHGHTDFCAWLPPMTLSFFSYPLTTPFIGKMPLPVWPTIVGRWDHQHAEVWQVWSS